MNRTYEREIPPRLVRMFNSIRKILKTLLSEEKWPALDGRLDVELLTQELRHGVCDFSALIEWLGFLLRASCSPHRDEELGNIISTMKRGVQVSDACVIAGGLQQFFDMLEMMKIVSVL